MNYLKKQIYKFDFFEKVCLVLILEVTFFTGRYFSFNNKFAFILAGIFLGIISILLLNLRDKYLKNKRNYIKGKLGEDYVESLLKKYPNNFRYVRSVSLRYGDVDFLVVSKNGIFCIEVKNSDGIIDYNKEKSRFIINNYDCERDFIKQINKNTYQVDEIIKKKFNRDFYINAVLVFANAKARLEINEPIEGVDVITAKNIIRYLNIKRSDQIDIKLQETIKNYFEKLNNGLAKG